MNDFECIVVILLIVSLIFIGILWEIELCFFSSFFCYYRKKHKKKLIIKDFKKLNNEVKHDNKITNDSIYDMVCDIMAKYLNYYCLENKNKNEIKEFFSFVSYVFGLTKICNFNEKVKKEIIRCIFKYDMTFLFGEDFNFESSNLHIQFNEFKMLKIFEHESSDTTKFKVCNTKTNQEYLIDGNAFADLLNDSNLTIDKVCLSETY